MNKRILFAPTEWLSDLRYVEPLIKKISQQNECSFFYFHDPAYDRVVSEIKKRGLPYEVYPYSQTQRLNNEDEVSNKISVSDLAKGKLFIWPGLYLDLGFSTEKKIKEMCESAQRKREAFNNVLKKEAPDYLVVRDGQSLNEKWMCEDSKKQGVRVVALPSYLDQLSLIPYIFSPLYDFRLVDLICVMGERCREILSKVGVPDEKIRVTGSPMFAELNDYKRKSPERLKREMERYSISPDLYQNGIILITLQGFKEGEVLLNHLEKMMSLYPDKLLIAKGHPIVTSRLRYFLSRKRKAANVLLTMDLDLKTVLPHCELLITMDSVTAFDAIRSDIPVLISGLSSRFYFFDFIDDGAVFKINRQEEIIPAVKRLLSDEKLKTELRCGRQRTMHAFEPPSQTSPVDAIASVFES